MNNQDKMLKDLLTGKIAWWFNKPEELMTLAMRNVDMKTGLGLMEDICQFLHDMPEYVKQGRIIINDELFDIIPPRLKTFILKLNSI